MKYAAKSAAPARVSSAASPSRVGTEGSAFSASVGEPDGGDATVAEGAGVDGAELADGSDGSGSLVGDDSGEEGSAVGVGARTVGWDSALLQAANSTKSAAAVSVAAACRHLPPGGSMPGTIAA